MKTIERNLNKIGEFFEQDWEKVEFDEDLLEVTLKANEFYSNIIKEYMITPIVIKLNMINHVKEKFKDFESLSDANNYIVEAIKQLKKKKEKSKTEEIELETLIDFREDVIRGNGDEYDITKGFRFKYEEQDVDFDPIKAKVEEN
jgi:hypothetical protein